MEAGSDMTDTNNRKEIELRAKQMKRDFTRLLSEYPELMPFTGYGKVIIALEIDLLLQNYEITRILPVPTI